MKQFMVVRCFTLERKTALIEELKNDSRVSEIDVSYVSDYANNLFYYLITWYEKI